MSDGDEGGGDSGAGWMSRRWVRLGGTAALIVIIAGLALWWFVFRDDAPPAVDLETAVAQVEDGDATSEPAPDGIAGTWTLDTTTGDFDFETATGSFAGTSDLRGN